MPEITSLTDQNLEDLLTCAGRTTTEEPCHDGELWHYREFGAEHQIHTRSLLHVALVRTGRDAAFIARSRRALPLVTEELLRLRRAIREHRDQRADDRCWQDDDRLYLALGDGELCDRRVGDTTAMLANCARFLERRCEGGFWPSYVDLERERDRLRDRVSVLETWAEVIKSYARDPAAARYWCGDDFAIPWLDALRAERQALLAENADLKRRLAELETKNKE